MRNNNVRLKLPWNNKRVPLINVFDIAYETQAKLNNQDAIIEIQCYSCKGFGHIAIQYKWKFYT